MHSDLVYQTDDDHIEMLMEQRHKTFQNAGLPITIPHIFEAILDSKIFNSYEGDVYFHNTCYGLGSDISGGHLPSQNPIKISEGESTKVLTPRDLLNKLTAGVVFDPDNHDEFTHYASNNVRPLFVCSNHKELNELQVLQFKHGVLILFTFGF